MGQGGPDIDDETLKYGLMRQGFNISFLSLDFSLSTSTSPPSSSSLA